MSSAVIMSLLSTTRTYLQTGCVDNNYFCFQVSTVTVEAREKVSLRKRAPQFILTLLLLPNRQSKARLHEV